MSKAEIADRKPIKVELTDGDTKRWCACGLNKESAYCNASHKGSGIAPLLFTAEKTGDAHLCMCKQTKNPPYCDGTHANL